VESEIDHSAMDADPVQADPLARPTPSNGVEGSEYDPLAVPAHGVMPPKGMPMLPMMGGPIPPMMPPFPPVLFPPPGLMMSVKKKKWADAPKEFPTTGEGFPFPQGGWAYGQSVGKPYDYQKSDMYQELMKEAAKRTTMQLAFTYLLDVQPKVADYVAELENEMQILIIESDDPIDVSDSIICCLFKANNIKHKAIHLSDLADLEVDAKKSTIILSDTLHALEVPAPIATALKAFVSHGGLLLSFNNSVSVISSTFTGKLKPRLGSTAIDKPIEISTHLSSPHDATHFEKYDDLSKSHKQLVRLHGLQRFEVIDAKHSVTSIITESAPQAGQPIAISFQFGQSKARGTVYHSTTSHIVARIGAQGGTSFQPLTDMLPAQSIALAKKCIEDLNKLRPIPNQTISAWQAALNAGFPACINIALSYYPFLDSLFSLLVTSSSK
jgi:hypothetical protein